MLESLRRDFRAVFDRDPAARSGIEVFLTCSGFHAVVLYRIAHTIDRAGIPLIPRLISHLARWVTGIEIHPKAVIGSGFFIDHGMGVVIGETSEIGENVTLFQGVTLGGTGKEQGKRHPTLGDNVVVGAGAKILGGIEIGSNVKIGANSVVLRSVPPDTTVVGVPGKVMKRLGPNSLLDHTNLPDPIMERLDRLEREVDELRKRIDQIPPDGG
ncbi:MAG TPA: serine O-acetyltransferase [Nitrospiria bacterium]|nr:serine O-acetyltransferase [Nitrospiria bacterium]